MKVISGIHKISEPRLIGFLNKEKNKKEIFFITGGEKKTESLKIKSRLRSAIHKSA